jgi:hypothetical protein
MSLTAKGVDEAQQHVAKMAARSADPRPLWRQIAPVVVDAERRQFLRGFTKKTSQAVPVLIRRPGAKRSLTRQRHSRARYSLVDSGHLRRSLTKRSITTTGGGPDTVFNTSRFDMEFGTSVFYARFLRKRGFTLITVDRTGRAEIQGHVKRFLIGDHR